MSGRAISSLAGRPCAYLAAKCSKAAAIRGSLMLAGAIQKSNLQHRLDLLGLALFRTNSWSLETHVGPCKEHAVPLISRIATELLHKYTVEIKLCSLVISGLHKSWQHRPGAYFICRPTHLACVKHQMQTWGCVQHICNNSSTPLSTRCFQGAQHVCRLRGDLEFVP